MTQTLWDDGPSILAVLREAGEQAADVELPDEPPSDPSQVRFSGGSLDGVLGHHGADLVDAERQGGRRGPRLWKRRGRAEPELLPVLVQLVEHGGDEERAALYRAAQDDAILRSIDELLAEVGRRPDLWLGVAPHARWLVDEGRHRGPVKLGIALLGATGDRGDLERISTLAQHDEFGLFSAVAFTNLLDDPVDALWASARAAQGWGKIQAVERLAPLAGDRPDVQRWLLTDGCANSVMNEYLGFACAVGGHLAATLEGEVDDDVLDGACVIVDALCVGGPAEGMRDYDDGAATVSGLLAHLRTRCDRVSRLEVVVSLRRWLEDDAADAGWPDRDELLRACREIIGDPAWPDRIQARFDAGDATGEWLSWSLAPSVGVDLWDALFERLRERGPEMARVFNLASRATTRERQTRLVEWAETTLPLAELASGPAQHLFPSASTRDTESALEYILQEGRSWDRVVTAPLLVAGARAAVTRSRYRTAELLAAVPRSEWGPHVEAAVRQTAADDPVEDSRQAFQALLDRD